MFGGDRINGNKNIIIKDVSNSEITVSISDVKDACLESLYIILIVESKPDVNANADLRIIESHYGESAESWIPFIGNGESDTIVDLLREFQERTGIGVNLIDCTSIQLDDGDFMLEFRDDIMPKCIFITDALAISQVTREFLGHANNKSADSGFLWLMDAQYPEPIRQLLTDNFTSLLNDTHKRFYTKLTTACLNLELEASTKKVFFRRLLNIASNKDIRPNSTRQKMKQIFGTNPAVEKIKANGDERNK